MGYYVRITAADWFIPTTKLDEALESFRELNTHDELKRGGSRTEKWFSWMNMCRYESVPEVLENLGFESTQTDSGIRINGYDSKTGQEELFLERLAPLVDEGAYIEWYGEDGEMWRNQVRNGKLVTLYPHTNWAERD